MFTLCWAAKGGSGTTVVSAALALTTGAPALLVDLAGDLPVALGLPGPSGPGIAEWAASTAPASRLDALRIRLSDRAELLPRGHATPAGRWDEFGAHLAGLDVDVVVDAGTGVPPAGLRQAADRSLLVTRPCYLSLRRAVEAAEPVDGVVLVDEPGRALRAEDVAAALGAPVVTTLPLDPAVARAVDAGLLLSRLPGAFRRNLGPAA